MCIRDRSKPGKVKVTFEELHERDVVLSHAYLLHSDCSVEVVIPEHLAPLKRHLESFAYRMRRNARESDNGKVSTQVRLNDENWSLVLAVRRSGQEKWSHYTREDLRKEDAENKRAEAEAGEEEEEEEEDFEAEYESEEMTT